MKKVLVMLAAAFLCFGAMAAEPAKVEPQNQNSKVMKPGYDYSIVKDETVNGVRYITAKPSEIVCSKAIDIQVKGEIIQSVIYTGGCNGNAKGIGALIEGMTVDDAIKRLDGITCGRRPTSCPDQLSKVLKTAFKK